MRCNISVLARPTARFDSSLARPTARFDVWPLSLLTLALPVGACAHRARHENGASTAAVAPPTQQASAPTVVDYAAVVAAPDCSAQDRALDAGRRPADLLAFLALEPGMRVAEIGAAGGYTAELIARTISPSGIESKSRWYAPRSRASGSVS
jgi:hypothetical protein